MARFFGLSASRFSSLHSSSAISWKGIVARIHVRSWSKEGISMIWLMSLCLMFYAQLVMTMVTACLALTSLRARTMSLKYSSSRMMRMVGTWSIKARGPCFNSPALKASACLYVCSFSFKAPSRAIA